MRKKLFVIVRTKGERNLLLEESLNSLCILTNELDIVPVLAYHGGSNQNEQNHFISEAKELVAAYRKYFSDILEFDYPAELNRNEFLVQTIHQVVKTANSHDFLSFLDDDDIYYPSFSKLLTAMKPEANFGLAQAYSSYGLITDKGRFYTQHKFLEYSKNINKIELLIGNYIPIHSFVVQVSLLDNIKILDKVDVFEDWAILLQIISNEKFSPNYLNEPVCEYRKLAGVKSATKYNWETSRQSIVKNLILPSTWQITGKDVVEFSEKHFEMREKLRKYERIIQRIVSIKRILEKIPPLKLSLKILRKLYT
jgi:hypothetical protein